MEGGKGLSQLSLSPPIPKSTREETSCNVKCTVLLLAQLPIFTVVVIVTYMATFIKQVYQVFAIV